MAKNDKDLPKYKGSELIRAATGVHKDILTAVLKPDELYTDAQAKGLRAKFMNKEVSQHGRKLDGAE